MHQSKMSIGGIAYNKVGLNGNSSDSLIALLDLIDGFNQVTDFDQILDQIGEASKSIMNAQASSLMLLDNEKNELCITSCTGPVKDEIKGKCIARDQGFSGWVAEHKLPLIANDVNNDPAGSPMFGGELSKQFTTKNLICAPLLDKENNVLGVIEAINRFDPQRLTENDIPIFQALANHAATAIERCKALQQQDNRMQEQDMYLTEIHHRVKNDLALISGIVEIESLDIEDEKAKSILKNIQSRIKSMAVVYELLSGEGSNNKAEVGTYFKKLVEGISDSLKNRTKNIDIRVNAESVVLDPYKALSCGLILNELLLNAYKHAFEQKDEGLITIDVTKKDRQVTIDYKDNGQGFPEDFKMQQQDSLGFKMINALIKQLDGTFELHNDNGAHFIITFETSELGQEKPDAVLKRK